MNPLVNIGGRGITRACSRRTTAIFNRDVIESGNELKGVGPVAQAPRLATEARSVGRAGGENNDERIIGGKLSVWRRDL
jgi:hypothetical protein